MIYTKRKLGTCPKCGKMELIDFELEEDSISVNNISIPCSECKHELEFENFFPIVNAKLIKHTLVHL